MKTTLHRHRLCNKKYYAKNREEILRRRKRYYKKNKEKINRCSKRYYKNNKAKISRHHKRYCKKNKEKLRDRQYRRLYGVAALEVKRLKKIQKNKCAICARRFVKTPNVDHDHKTGKVRGLLCGFCNRGLGMFQESRESLKTAIDYLTVAPA